ncbi:MAG: patatin-like phospholipase family protein [Saprospiraceae bacterium]|nr:patatin-like phospholipase family protein [Saprospiraceae bacterium]
MKAEPSDSKNHIGLVLSGGGIRGVAHIGVIRALEEAGIFPDMIAGTSAGALVGALYAAGKSWQEMLTFFKEASIFRISNFAHGKPGLINSDKFYELYRSQFMEDSFEHLKKPLFIATCDLMKGREKLFSKGPLIKALLASAALPGVFSPIEINGALYADGGILNNFPVEPLLPLCSTIWGVYVNPIEELIPEDLDSTRQVVERAFHLTTRYPSLRKLKSCTHIICPAGLSAYATFSINAEQEIFELGYREAIKSLAISLAGAVQHT